MIIRTEKTGQRTMGNSSWHVTMERRVPSSGQSRAQIRGQGLPENANTELCVKIL